MTRFSVEVDTDRPDNTRDEIERHLSVLFHKPVTVRRVATSKARMQ